VALSRAVTADACSSWTALFQKTPTSTSASGSTSKCYSCPAAVNVQGEWRKLFAQAGFEITRILPMKAAESLIERRLNRA